MNTRFDRLLKSPNLVALPIVSMLVAAVLVAIVLGWLALREADSYSVARQADVVLRSLQARAEQYANQLTPQVYWDEAVEKVRSGDLEWLDDNFGPYLHEIYGFSETYVLDSANRPIYGSRGGERVPPDRFGEIAVPAQSALTDVRNADIEIEEEFGHIINTKTLSDGAVVPLVKIAHFDSVRGAPAILVAATIIPESDSSLLSGRQPYLLVAVKPIDDDVLAELVHTHGFEGLRWDTQSEPARGLVEIANDEGGTIGTLSWIPSLPSRTFLGQLSPALFIAAIVLILAAVGAVLGGRRYAMALASARERAVWDADHDALTGLPNRRLFDVDLARAIERHVAEGGALALISIDLDRFKELNDNFGHPAGNHALAISARRIRGCVPTTCEVARVGGDEFQIILTGEAVAGAIDIAAAIISAMAEPIELAHGVEAHLGGSIGIAYAKAETAVDLARHADIAMSAAKRRGRNRIEVFDPAMEKRLRHRLDIENELRAAIRDDQLSVAYQPVVSGDGQAIVGAEALVRWQHPKWGAVAPSDFIPVAEQSSLIGEIGGFVLTRACHDAASWPHLKVMVNLSATELLNFTIVDTIRSALRVSGLDAARLEIELGEAAILQDEELTASKIDAIRELGVSVALDNFGAGLSPLSSLCRLRFSRVKIDRSVVRDIGIKQGVAEMVIGIVGVCRANGIAVTAEGVETAEQQRFLQAAGCETLQGYLFHQPITAREMSRMAMGAEAIRIA